METLNIPIIASRETELRIKLTIPISALYLSPNKRNSKVLVRWLGSPVYSEV